MVNNIKTSKKENSCIVTVNPKVYALDVIYSAAYVFIDKAYVIIDGDPKKEVKVLLKPKKESDLEKLGLEFSNELLNYAFYKKQSNKNKGIREAIMQRALITNDPSIIEDDELFDEEIDDYLEDPEGIAIPWGEKYGEKAKKKK